MFGIPPFLESLVEQAGKSGFTFWSTSPIISAGAVCSGAALIKRCIPSS